jgi:DNA invertase Pin-like site-specific DNA recombinase
MTTAIRSRQQDADRRETRRLIAAVGYCRMSTDEQENSIPKQREEIAKYAAANGYKIVRWYIDEGQRGDDESRASFVDMIKDVQTVRDFEAIIIWNQKRFARMNFLKTAKYWDILDEAEIKLFSVREGLISGNDIGSMLTTVIRQNEAHSFSVDLGAEVCTEQIKTAKRGHIPGAKAPYGYKSVPATDDLNGPRKFAIDESKAWAVRMAFDLFVNQGRSFRQIAAALNDKNAPSPALTRRRNMGDGWFGYNVKDVLKNEKYTGSMIHGKQTKAKYYRRSGDEIERVPAREKGKRQAVDRSQWTIVPGAHDAIVTQEQFNQAQAIMAGRKKHKRGGTAKITPLSGLCCCGHCGNKLGACVRRSSDQRKDWTWRGMRCSTFSVRGDLPAECRYCLQLDYLASEVFRQIETDYLSDEAVAHYRQAISKHLLRQRSQGEGQAAKLGKTLEDVEAKLIKADNRLLDVPHDIAPALYRQIRELKDRRQKLIAEIAAQSQLVAISERVISDQGQALVSRLKEIRSKIRSADPALARGALEAIIEKVTVWTEPVKDRRPGQGKNIRRELSRVDITYKSPICVLNGSAAVHSGLQIYLEQLTLEALSR